MKKYLTHFVAILASFQWSEIKHSISEECLLVCVFVYLRNHSQSLFCLCKWEAAVAFFEMRLVGTVSLGDADAEAKCGY